MWNIKVWHIINVTLITLRFAKVSIRVPFMWTFLIVALVRNLTIFTLDLRTKSSFFNNISLSPSIFDDVPFSSPQIYSSNLRSLEKCSWHSNTEYPLINSINKNEIAMIVGFILKWRKIENWKRFSYKCDKFIFTWTTNYSAIFKVLFIYIIPITHNRLYCLFIVMHIFGQKKNLMIYCVTQSDRVAAQRGCSQWLVFMLFMHIIGVKWNVFLSYKKRDVV